MSTIVNFVLNGNKIRKTIEEDWTLLHLLRNEMGLTGTKEGCGSGECGACTVIIDGKAVNACIYLSAEINDKTVITIEGLSDNNGRINSLQRAFVENGGVQCGFCTPGMILSATALLDEKNNPSVEDIKHALAGNMCRCTGYSQIIDSVQAAVGEKQDT